MESIFQTLANYVVGLDWSYIMTFILSAYIINHSPVSNGISKVIQVKARTRYRIALVGLILGVVLFLLRGYTLDKVEVLLHSFAFALVFHKLILDGIFQYLGASRSATPPGNPSPPSQA
jgi:hypothetical protein